MVSPVSSLFQPETCHFPALSLYRNWVTPLLVLLLLSESFPALLYPFWEAGTAQSIQGGWKMDLYSSTVILAILFAFSFLVIPNIYYLTVTDQWFDIFKKMSTVALPRLPSWVAEMSKETTFYTWSWSSFSLNVLIALHLPGLNFICHYMGWLLYIIRSSLSSSPSALIFMTNNCIIIKASHLPAHLLLQLSALGFLCCWPLCPFLAFPTLRAHNILPICALGPIILHSCPLQPTPPRKPILSIFWHYTWTNGCNHGKPSCVKPLVSGGRLSLL